MPQGVATRNFRPQLAVDADWDYFERLLKQGDRLIASPKLDGIRCLILDGRAVSRTLKPIRNRHIQAALSSTQLQGLDGELIVGLPYGVGVFARTTSGVMSEFGNPDFKYYVFDNFLLPPGMTYISRQEILEAKIGPLTSHPHLDLLESSKISSLKELQDYEQSCISRGYEGTIIRWELAPYKFGRSTLRERYMLKLKRFLDSEAEIIGFEPLRRNMNEAEFDNLGLQKRSSHKDNKIADDLLGAVIVRDLQNPLWEFKIGTGFDVFTRDYIWCHQEEYLGKTAKYRYLPVGTKDLPRHPVWMGMRHKDDM